MTRLFVTLGEGRQVPDLESGGKLLLVGEVHSVPNTAYWQRRLKDQDVIAADPPAEESKVPEPVNQPEQPPAEPMAAKRSATK
jgi:hypothetical protein